MFSSWQGKVPNHALGALKQEGLGVCDPLMLFPTEPSWEIVNAAYFLSGYTRYGNSWSPLDLEMLEREVESTYLRKLNSKDDPIGQNGGTACNKYSSSMTLTIGRPPPSHLLRERWQVTCILHSRE